MRAWYKLMLKWGNLVQKQRGTAIIVMGTWLLLISCIDLNDLFSNTVQDSRGYTKDELGLFYSFAKLAATDFNNLDRDDLNGLESQIRYGVKTHTITYDSRYGNEEVKGSAAFIYPDGTPPEGGWPILISVHHTLLQYKEAPSVVVQKARSFDFSKISEFDVVLHPLLLSSGTGFAVYSPDLLGFGASKEKGHPFTQSAFLLYDIMAGLEALITQMETRGIPLNKKRVFITGYSHGGWLATKLYKHINTHYDTEYTVVGGVSSAGVYDLQRLTSHLLTQETSDFPLFFPYMLYGYKVSNAVSIDYADYYKEPYASLDFEHDLFNGFHDNKYVDNKLSSDRDTLFHTDFVNSFEAANFCDTSYSVSPTTVYQSFWDQLASDSIEPWTMSGTLYIIHHELDAVSPVCVVDNFKDGMDAANPSDGSESPITYKRGKWGDPKSSEHEATALVTYVSGLYWLTKLLDSP